MLLPGGSSGGTAGGMGNSWTVYELTALVQSYIPKMVFLSETRQCESRMKNLRWRIGMKGCLAMPVEGKAVIN